MADISVYFCKVCNSRMNSKVMWDNHITGKRHLKNLKNKDEAGNDPPIVSRGERSTEPAKIETFIASVQEPVIGLNYICELQFPDSSVHPNYSCNLCAANIGMMGVIDHITSTKHRLAYIKETDPEGHLIIESMLVSKIPIDGLALERAAALETKHGRGNVEVKVEKSKFGALASMRKRSQNPADDSEGRGAKAPIASLSGNSEDGFDTKTKEFFTRIPYMDLDAKINILLELSTLEITNDEEAKDVLNVVTNLSHLLMQNKMRLLAAKPPPPPPPPPEDYYMGVPEGRMRARDFIPPYPYQQGDMGHPNYPAEDWYNTPVGYPQPRRSQRPGFRGRNPNFM